MTGLRLRNGLVLLAALAAGCGEDGRQKSGRDGATESVLRVAIHTEPQTWNKLLAADRVTNLVTDQIHEPLLRLDAETQEMEPALAESWEFSPYGTDGTRLVLHLRSGLRFSDGEPMTAEDVAFTFRALYDEKVASPLLETAMVDGKPFVCEVVDETTVAFVVPRRTAPLERVFDAIPILPAHVFRESLEQGDLPAASGLSAPPERVVGLGPFRLRRHLPGQRIVLERNPYYWKRDDEGRALPRLSRMVFEILPDENARLLRLRAGEVDLVELVSPEGFSLLESDASPDIVLRDLGPGLMSERLWFNLVPDAPIAEHKKAWFRDARFRRAISSAIDREGMARVVFGGRASAAAGPVSIANESWRNGDLPPMEFDPEAALALLRQAGFARDDEGQLCDASGNPVSFTIITNLGNDQHARMGAFLQEDLAKIGIDARAVTIEPASLLARFTGSFDYEAGLLGIAQTDPDPSADMAFWVSRSSLHLWNPGQDEPATPWEARIDELMEHQLGALDPRERRRLYFEVQRIVSEQMPVLDLVVPHVLLATRRGVTNLRPTPLGHFLWNREEIFVSNRGEKTTWVFGDSRHRRDVETGVASDPRYSLKQRPNRW
jgi:peptide/nickel transport system substrate-binding protein